MIIEKIKDANLRGRGGAGFPTAAKWEMVLNAPGDKKYVICNVSEGEPAVTKDGYILERYPKDVIEGMKLALGAIKGSQGIIYLRKDYFKKYGSKLKALIMGLPVEIFEETCGYLGGEETTLLEVIEGNRAEPRFKPPYPPQSGLYGCPTLINNLETFYCVAKIAERKYFGGRFYSISGDVKKPGVYELNEDLSIVKILRESGNLPAFEFFVQAGGGASGQILLESELDQPLAGAGSIVVYDKRKTDLSGLMKKWSSFFINENCGKCVPCREGVYRLNEMLKNSAFDAKRAQEIIAVLKNTSFCPFGRGVANSFESLINKLWNQDK
jgi:NADH:ubiquinone oxidoreductase subunit F (NADH-binding)